MKGKAKKLRTKALSFILVLAMLISTFPVASLTALAAGVPDSLVTSLAQFYDGDEDRARADLEAMYAAELLDDDGKLVDLDIREDGESVELDALAERITNGETVGEITVNGNEATAEQIVKISQVKAALEIAALLDEDIDVTDKHVENLESLLTGIADGSVDLEGALKTGELSLSKGSTNDITLMGATDELPETISYYDGRDSVYDTTIYQQGANMYLLPLNENRDGYIAPYVNGSVYEKEHNFKFYDDTIASRYYYYTAGSFTASTSGELDKTAGKNAYIDWDKMISGTDGNPYLTTVTIVMPLKTDAELQSEIQNWIAGETDDCTNKGVGITMSLPNYGEVVLTKYMTSMYLSDKYARYPIYVITTENEAPVALAARFATPNLYDYVRQNTACLYMKSKIEGTDGFDWNDSPVDELGYHRYNGSEWPVVSGFSYQFYAAPASDFNFKAYIERESGTWEQAEKGFIKLKNPENPDFPYVRPDQPGNPERQYDAEFAVTEDFYNAFIRGYIYMDSDEDLRFKILLSDRRPFFTFVEDRDFAIGYYQVTETPCGNGNREYMVIPKEASSYPMTWTLKIWNGKYRIAGSGGGVTGGMDSDYHWCELEKITLLDETAPFLKIPSRSRIRETLTGLDTDIYFTSNLTVPFTAELYSINEIDENNLDAIPDGATKLSTYNTNTPGHITIPGTALNNAGNYAVKISADSKTAVAFIRVKQGSAKVTLNKLDSYGVVKDNVPTIGYTLTSATNTAEVKYTVQGTGEAVSEMKDATGGTIPFTPGEFEGLKKAYTITVYARNKAEDAWSVDSMILTVYNTNPLKLILNNVPFGGLGGTTGGKAEGGSNEAGSSFVMDNNSTIQGMLASEGDGSGYKVNFDSFDTLRHNVNLQKIISANYGSGTWGILSDKMNWASKGSDGNLNDDVTLNYEQRGAYKDIRGYSYTSYIPTSDFLITATKNISGDSPVTVTATHALTGLQASVNVTVNTLQDKLYLFRFNPKAVTDVIYTNGAGVERKLKTDANGELAVYEPDGIDKEKDMIAMSNKDGDTYVGTFSCSNLVTGEQNITKLELYPCNNFTLRKVSDCTLTFLKPDGKPYKGKVTLRGGVYAGGEYCPDAKIRTEKDINSHQYLREDIEFTTNADGKTTVYFDPTQFTSESGKTWANGLQYVFEYRFEDTYQPGYVLVNSSINNPAESIVNLKSMRGNGKVPTIVRQDYQQYQSNGKKTAYTRNVMDYADNIGISPNFNKSELYTDIVMLGEKVVPDEKGYSTYSGENATGFALYTKDGKKLTGQTDLSEAKTITKLSDLNNATFFVFPFSAVPMLRSTYTMTDENMTADGITDQGDNPTPTARIKAVFKKGDMTVRTISMPFGVTNVSHQPDLNSNQGATAVGKEVRDNLRETTDIGAIFRSINVNDMIRKGFVFLGNLAGAGGDNPINLMILPTQDPATFRIIAFIGANQRGGDDDDGVSVNFNSQDLAEDMTKFKKEMDELNKKKDDEEDSGGEGSMEFNFYGTIILEAHAGVKDGKWSIAFRGGNVGTNVKGKYEWGQTFMCGPDPAFISFETGFHADLEVAFGNKAAARAMLLDAALGVSVEAFAGLGFDLSIVALQLGIYGQIGADVNFLLLTPSDAKPSTGTKLTINGEIGIKLKVKLLFVSYSKKFASTGFNWSKKWNNYDKIKQYWTDQGYAQLFGTTKSGRAYTMLLFEDGSTMVAIEGGAELENRDYLELADRAWNSGKTGIARLFSKGSATDAITDVQTNSYPHSHPAFTDDGEMFLYISDNDNAQKVESVASYAIKNDNGYANKERIDTSSDNVLADLDVVASGTKDNAFAAWVKQVETPKGVNTTSVTNDELGMMFNATEIYAGLYNGTDWTTTRLTDNNVADMAPTVASSGNNAIVAWRSMNASALPDSDDGILIDEDFENNKIPSGWSTSNWSVNDRALYTDSASGTVDLPVFDLSASYSPRLSFKYKTVNLFSIKKNQLKVQYSEDSGTTWIDLTDAMISKDWETVELELPKKNVQIRFNSSKVEGANNPGQTYIDDIVLTAGSNPYDVDMANDLSAMFDVENNINYSIYNGSAWTTAQVAYNGTAGTVNAIDSAMLDDGTAILTYTVRTGEDVASTETFYTVVGADGNVITNGRLTNDSYTDTNAQVTAVNDESGKYFVLGWYSEHDAGEGMTSEYDAEGNATQKAVLAHDIRLARINANGSYDIDFPESIGGTGEKGISSDFRFAAPANNSSIENVSVVWSQRKDSNEADDAGKYELNAVRFYKAGNVTGLTAPTDIAETDKNYTIDRFDTYTDNTGAIHAIILGSDYNSIKGIEKYDSIDLNSVTKELGENESNSDSPNNIDILDGEAISSLKLATGTFPEVAADVTADVNIGEVIPGFTTPVQFTVTNKGTSVMSSVKATVGDQNKDFTGLNLLPNQSATLLMSYNIPEGAVSDADYTVKTGDTELGSGTLKLNRPDVGISGIRLLQENEGMRDIQIMLTNNYDIPLAGSKKTVKLAFYKDPFHESMIGKEVSISGGELADIDEGTYTTVQTLDVTDLYEGDGEIPEEGLTVYAHAWVEDTDEPDIYNNDNYISFTGLLTRNNGEKLTIDTTIEENEDGYTVYADIRNNSIKETNVGTPVVVLLDSNDEVIAQKNFQDKSLSLNKEQSKELSVAFTASDLGDKTPAQAVVGSVCTVTFDINGGSGTFDPVQTDLDGHITLPTTQPTPPTGGAEELFFAGWYTAAEGGDLVTAETTFKEDTKLYAHYVTHQHKFTYSADGDTITATCSANSCTLPEVDGKHTDTLTIVAPTLTKYGETGKSAEATLTDGIDGVTNPDVEYWNGDEKLASAPTEPGTYTASITLGEGDDAATARVQYTIEKRNVTLTSATATKEYDGTALTNDNVTVSGDGWANGEGATYTVTGSQKVVGSSGNTFTYELNNNTKADNYIITTSTGTLTVTNRTAKYEISPQANSSKVKYDGTEKTVSGFKTETFTVDGNTYTVSGLTATGSGTDADTYTVSVSGTAVVKDSDNNDVTSEFIVTPLTGTLTIEKRNVTLTSATDAKEYDGTALTNNNVTVTVDGFAEGEGAAYNFTGAQTLVGTANNTFTYTLNDNTKADNYAIITNYGTLTVNNRNTKYSVTLTADSGEFKYDGSAKNVTGWKIDGVAGGSFTAENGLSYTVSGMDATLTKTDAGSYDVTVTGTPLVKDSAGNDVTTQFAVSVEKGTLKINKRNVTLTSATDSKAYDGTALTNDNVTVSGDGWATGEGATYNVTGSQTLPESSANAFNYVLGSGTKADNYEITKVEGTLTITNRNDTEPDKKYEITVKANSDTVTYDGNAHTVSGFETLEYTVGGVKYTVSGLTATVTETNAGTYTVPVTGTAVVKDTAGNDLTAQFIVTTENGSLTINKTAISEAIVGMDAFAYDEAVSTPAIVSNGKEGSNGAMVGADTTKQVTYYYQDTAFLKSQTDDISALDNAEGVYKTITPTTFEPGKHYVLAVITGDNYNNAPYITQSAFEVTQNTETVRTAPEAPAVDGTKVTVAEADREKNLEYSLDGETWLPAELDEKGEFTAQWANPVTGAELKLRETGNESYAKPSESVAGTAAITTTTFTVNYDANGGVKAPEATTVSADRTVTVSGKASMTRKGYTFTEWNTEKDGSGTAYKSGDTLSEGLTLYAQWEANTYKVHFNANGGTGTMEELEFTYNVANTLTENAFTRDEYVFLGWSTTANGSVQYQDKQEVKNIAESGTLNLYAVWAKDLYNINGKVKSAHTGDITLELVQGNNTFGEPKVVAYSTANDETAFALNGVPTGIYNLIAKQGDVTMTVAVNITDDHVELDTITMPAGNTSSVVDIKGDNAPAIVIGGLNDIAAAEEIYGRKILVAIAAETQNEAQVGKAGEAILNESRAQNAQFFDFTVTKTITNDGIEESTETITETKSLIEFVIPFDFSRKSAVKVYRYHDGAPEALTEADTGEEGTYRLDRTNGLIYVYAAKFSTYAIVYSNSGGGRSGGSSLATENTVTAQKADNGSVSVNPKNASKGSTVTITVTPDKGYKLGTLAVTDKDGKDIAVTEKDGKYTFTMPEGKVTVTPTFVKEDSDPITPPADNDNPFIDVKTGDYFYDAVLWAAKEGVTSGTTDTTFSPDESCTRGQTVTFLWRAAGSPEPTTNVNPFTDVKTGDYFYKAVLWAYENGITQGTSDKEFSPNATVTRGQTVTFLHRLTGDKANGKNPFTDVKTSDYFYDAVLWAAEENITSGTSDTTFSPDDDCLRGQIVTFLYRYYK